MLIAVFCLIWNCGNLRDTNKKAGALAPAFLLETDAG